MPNLYQTKPLWYSRLTKISRPINLDSNFELTPRLGATLLPRYPLQVALPVGQYGGGVLVKTHVKSSRWTVRRYHPICIAPSILRFPHRLSRYMINRHQSFGRTSSSLSMTSSNTRFSRNQTLLILALTRKSFTGHVLHGASGWTFCGETCEALCR